MKLKKLVKFNLTYDINLCYNIYVILVLDYQSGYLRTRRISMHRLYTRKNINISIWKFYNPKNPGSDKKLIIHDTYWIYIV